MRCAEPDSDAIAVSAQHRRDQFKGSAGIEGQTFNMESRDAWAHTEEVRLITAYRAGLERLLGFSWDHAVVGGKRLVE
jgi:hypothetical protein